MLSTLYLMPTQRCNGCCDYCYLSSAEKQKQADERFLVRVLQAFIHALNCKGNDTPHPQLRFIGGEPYLEIQTIWRLTRTFLNSFPTSMVAINTNGTLIRESDLASMSAYRTNLYHVVSLDGPEHIHNARRRLKNTRNAYSAVVSGIEILRDQGFPVYVNMVLDRHSIRGIEELMSLIKNRLGLDALSVSLRQSPSSPMSNREKFCLLRTTYEYAERHNIRLTGHHRLLLGSRVPGLMCHAGDKSVLVSSDGRLNVCQRFVGKAPKAPRFSGDLASPAPLPRPFARHICYTRDVMTLADRLHRLYTKRYPRYLSVGRLDRILFGTI